MEIRKTTLLSFLVFIAGILAEIIFRDVLAKSAFGVVLSVLLAVVIIVLAYFFYDGFYSFLTAEREMDKKLQEDYEQKLYSILNEQLQFEKAIYKEVHALMQGNEETDHAENVSVKVLEERLNRLEASINEHTTTTAKIVTKYVNHNTDEAKAFFEQSKNDLQSVMEGQEILEKIHDNIQTLLEEKEVLRQTQNDIQVLLEEKDVLRQAQSDIQVLLEEKDVLEQTQNGIQELLENKTVMAQLQNNMQAFSENQADLGKIQENIQLLLERQADIRSSLTNKTSMPELGQMQNDIQTLIKNGDDLKQNQSEVQSSIRKLAKIMGVLLSLLRGKRPDTEKS